MIAFEYDHPAVGTLFYVSALACTMCCFQPVLVVISFACAVVCSVVQLGWESVARMLRWQLPLVVTVSLVNPLFSAAGSTVLFRVGVRAIYLECLVYGAFLGTVLAASVLWFALAGSLLDSERLLAITAPVFPHLGLALALVLRQVPAVLNCGKASDELYRTAVRAGSAPSTVSLMRATDVAATNALEGSIVSARSMRARGYGACERRTSYRRFSFTARDAIKLAFIVAAACLCAFLGWAATSQYHFYPTLSVLRAWWGYAFYAAYLLLPALAAGVERLVCRG